MKAENLYRKIQKASYMVVGEDVNYMMTTIDGHPVLLFEETTTIKDWKINFLFPRKIYKRQESCMLVHGGYGRAWKSANDRIMQDFIELCEIVKTRPLIAGWSYGGAMAILASEDFYYRTKVKPTVVTFGAPKVAGNKRTAQYFSECGRFIQYAIINDIVPYLPPFSGFRHVHKVKIGSKFSIAQLVDPETNHLLYSDSEQYTGENNDINIQ